MSGVLCLIFTRSTSHVRQIFLS